VKFTVLDNAIAGDFEEHLEVPSELTDSVKSSITTNGEHTENEMPSSLNIGARHSHFLGQYTQLLQDKMKQDPEYIAVSRSYDPLPLYRLIENTPRSCRSCRIV
jgi:hypothetical protein